MHVNPKKAFELLSHYIFVIACVSHNLVVMAKMKEIVKGDNNYNPLGCLRDIRDSFR